MVRITWRLPVARRGSADSSAGVQIAAGEHGDDPFAIDIELAAQQRGDGDGARALDDQLLVDDEPGDCLPNVVFGYDEDVVDEVAGEFKGTRPKPPARPSQMVGPAG